MVDFNITKGIIMTTNYFIAPDKVTGNYSILYAHGKVIAYWQNCQIKGGAHRNEFHIHCKGSVTGYVNILMLTFYYKTSRLASITAIGKRTGMNGIHIF